ncbi:endonuclease III [Desulfurococcaceae archaeon MEX13E-LK6-19]|nr:endonuclease III [Desulfurococcaceae archaeon MEX13E-LK6-19]
MHSKYVDPSSFIVNYVKGRSLFEFIIAVLLSQNTSDKNAIKAFERLREVTGNSISPERILSLNINEIAEAIRPAGMHKERAKRIIEIAKLFSDKNFVTKLIDKLNKVPVEDARRILMEIPGVGRKTADVVLLMYFGKPTFPVDTHIMRITRRLGFINKNDYEQARSFWMKFLDSRDYLETHLLLITHGRRICKSRNPSCTKCLLAEYCPSKQETV